MKVLNKGAFLVAWLGLAMVAAGCGSSATSGGQQQSAPATSQSSGQQSAPATSPSSGQQSAQSQGTSNAAADFFKGKTINLVVTYSPGGGYDTYARLLAPYLQKYTGATVVVKNVTGGGGLVGDNEVYSAKANGLTLGLLNGPAMALGQWTKTQGVHFDLTKMTVLGQLYNGDEFLFMGPKSPYKTFNALVNAKNKVVKFGAASPSDSTYFRAVLTADVLGLQKAKVLTGYQGSNGITLAVEKGELDAETNSIASQLPKVKSGQLVPVLVYSNKPNSQLPNVKTIYDVPGLSSSRKQLANFLVGMNQMGRFLMAPPGLDKATTAFLQSAFQKAANDSTLQSQAKSKNLFVVANSASDVRKMIQSMFNAPPSIQQEVKAAATKYR